ncbi:MAG: hypothetical protein ACK4L4_15900 [Gemmobacter sp.]
MNRVDGSYGSAGRARHSSCRICGSTHSRYVHKPLKNKDHHRQHSFVFDPGWNVSSALQKFTLCKEPATPQIKFTDAAVAKFEADTATLFTDPTVKGSQLGVTPGGTTT